MTILDRAYQRALLLAMSETYPERLLELPNHESGDARAMNANLFYLEEHGLCDSGMSQNMSGFSHMGPQITARGMDFLEDDGGLSAILGVVTVKLHADTVRDLIAAKIDAAPIPETEKSALRQHLAGLSEAGLKAATSDLVKQGLDHLPDAIHWLRTVVGL